MGPKKQLTSSTPAVMKPSATFGISSDMSAPSTITESSFGTSEVVVKPPVLTKMSTLDLVLQAIETIGVPRKGASYLAIQKWIASSKDNVVINRLKANLKKAIVKALESGLLKRPNISKNVTGLRGYFILNKDKIVEKKKAEIKTAKKLVEKAKVNKVAKTKTVAVAPKTKPAAAPKTKPAAASKTKPAAAPTTKPAAAPTTKPAAAPTTKPAAALKTKPAAAPKSKPKVTPKDKPAASQKTKAAAETEETTEPKQKTKAAKPKQKTKAAKPKQDNSEAGPSKKPKVKAAVKPRPGKSPVPKSKPKQTAERHKPSKDLRIDQPQVAKSRESVVKFRSEEDLPHLVTKKAPSKPTNPTKEGRPRKLYNVDSPANISRKDLSDTELNVKPDNRKPLKSYASDTELEVTYNRKKVKVAKVVKNLDVKKPAKKETSKTGPSHANVKKRKGKNSTADDVFE